jgi:uncharacterized protein (DUF697 family)
MTRSQIKRSRQIIHGAALAGAVVAGGLAQIPASDNAVLVPIEILMVLGLGGVFRVPFRHSYRTSVIVGTAATMIGRGVSEVLVGWIPVLGNILDAVTAVAVIETLGWVIVRDFNVRVTQSGE